MTARALTVAHDALHRVFDGQQVRIVIRDGEPWFVASDVARVLGYERPADAVRAHCKGVGEAPIPTPGGTQTLKIIPCAASAPRRRPFPVWLAVALGFGLGVGVGQLWRVVEVFR